GKGDKFYDFIKAKLVPHIDSIYRTDKTNRTIMGHSFGGYFVLYTLTRRLKDAAIFNNFVAASPSIYYHDYYLIEEVGKSSYMRNTENTKVYLTIGERELHEYPSDDFQRMSEILTDNAIDVQSEVYKNQGHMGTAIPTFENGVRLFMGRQNSNKK